MVNSLFKALQYSPKRFKNLKSVPFFNIDLSGPKWPGIRAVRKYKKLSCKSADPWHPSGPPPDIRSTPRGHRYKGPLCAYRPARACHPWSQARASSINTLVPNHIAINLIIVDLHRRIINSYLSLSMPTNVSLTRLRA